MAMGFAQNYQPVDYRDRMAAGVTLDPNAPDQSAQFATPVPAAPAQAQSAPYKPSAWDVIQGVLFDGQSPAEAAMAARGRDYQQKTMALMADTLKSAPPDQRLAMLLNPTELGKAVSSRFASMNMRAGNTRSDGEGGATFTAPLTGVDAVSGKGYSVTPGGMTELGPSLGGGISVGPTGAEVSSRGGLTGRGVTLPQIVAPGSVPSTFTPQVTGPGAPGATAAPGGPAAAPSKAGATIASTGLVKNGSLDPLAFFKAFTGPHEGGLNSRDLNGAPSKYGINAKANPDVDLDKLTPEGAAQIFASKYYGPSGASHMPPALAAVVGDTAFINPKKAAQFLVQSGGDPQKYMDLREGWMNGLVSKYPQAQKYAQPWATRNADLRAVVGQLGGGGQQQSGPAAQGWSGPAAKVPTILDPTDPANAAAYANLPKGTVLQRAATGEISVLQRPEYSPEAKSTIRDHVLSSDAYKQAKASMSAYQAMMANANTMTGPSAYSMLDTFARAINPGAVARPTVIETIEKNLGLPAQLVGGLESKFGQGNLPPQVRQQIIDAVVPFAQAHWDQANMLNSANAALAKQHGFDASDVTGPLEGRPERLSLTVPPAPQRQPGFYMTPKGPLHWTGKGWTQ